MDAGEDLAVGAGAVVEREAQQLVGLLHSFAGLDLHGAEIGFAERVKIDRLLFQRLNFQRGQCGLLLCLLDRLELLNRLGRIDTRENGLALVYRHGFRELAPRLCRIPGGDIFRCADLCKNLLARIGHERQQQRRADTHGFEQVIHDGCQTRAVSLVLGKRPRGIFVDILVGALDAAEYLIERVLELEFLHLRFITATQAGEHQDQLVVDVGKLPLCRQRTAEVLLHHRRCARDQVAQVVGKINVDGIDEQFVGEIAVGAERERAQQEEAQRVDTKHLSQHIRVYHIALGLGHFAAIHDEPAVAVDLPGQRQIEAHEHRRPND